MKNLILFLTFVVALSFYTRPILAQEKGEKAIDLKKIDKVTDLDTNDFLARVGVVDMKRILSQSKAYQSLVDQFEEIRRKHRNNITKQEDQIRDEESDLIKQKNILSSEVYTEKVKKLNKKINELKTKQSQETKKFEISFEKSTNKIQGALVDVLSIIANEANLNLVLAKNQVILVGKKIDITDKAVVELNKVLPKISLGD